MAAREQERASDIHAEAKDRDQGRVAKATRTGQIARRKFSLPSESLVPSQKSAAVYRNNVTDDQHNAGLTLMQCSMRSEEHTSELQSLMRISYAVFCLKKKKHNKYTSIPIHPIPST